MPLIDTHAHLDEESLIPDRAEILARARAAGLERILCIGVSAASSRTVVELAQQEPLIAPIVGIHPNYCTQAAPHDFETVCELARLPAVVGIGETGLDKYWDFAPLDAQRDYFIRHIELSQTVQKPFVVHCREAEPETLEVLQEMARRGPLLGVMHSFCGSAETAAACLELGLYLSFAGMLTFKKNDELREVARSLPLDRVLVETDSPYLAPMPFRGKRNEPAYVVHTARCLAELHNLTIEEIGDITTANARRIFALPE
jgi:TatD DNase family protein